MGGKERRRKEAGHPRLAGTYACKAGLLTHESCPGCCEMGSSLPSRVLKTYAEALRGFSHVCRPMASKPFSRKSVSLETASTAVAVGKMYGFPRPECKKNVKYLINIFVLITCFHDNIWGVLSSIKYIIRINSTCFFFLLFKGR